MLMTGVISPGVKVFADALASDATSETIPNCSLYSVTLKVAQAPC